MGRVLAIVVALCVSSGLLLASSAPAQADVAASIDMLRTHNTLRFAAGAPTITADPRVALAAQRHADYNAANGINTHFETPGLPYYSGYSPRDRVAAAGRPTAFVSEVAGGFRSAAEAVQELWHAPYHRLGLMHPSAVATGWGHSDLNGRSSTIGNLVYDFGARPVDFVRSPGHLQTGIPTSWSGRESPSPLPAGVSGPVGYPIMVVYSGAQTIDMRAAELVRPDGSRVPIYYVPQIWERDYQVIIPQQPLAAATKYHIRFDLTLNGRWITDEWDFFTVGAPATSVPMPPSGFHSRWHSQSAWPTLAAGQVSDPIEIRFTNTGSSSWVKGVLGQEARLGIPGDVQTFAPLAVDWPFASRPAAQTETVVAPGAVGTFTFRVRALSAPGNHVIRLRPVIDGATWMEDEGVYIVVTVR